MMKKKSVAKEIFGWVRYLLVAVILVLVLNNFLIANAVVISPSMEDTIMTDSRVIGSRIAYVFGDPQRFDIILFIPPDDSTSVPYVKRIIGLPNEKVEIIGG
jgi:signal peptidase I